MNTDTPRTDELAIFLTTQFPATLGNVQLRLKLEEQERCERELNEAQQERNELRKERDKLRVELEQARKDMQIIVDNSSTLTKEQEQGLRAEVERLKQEIKVHEMRVG